MSHPAIWRQVSFATVQALMDVRRELMPVVRRNRAAEEAQDGFDEAVDLASIKNLTLTLALFIADWCGVEPI